MDEKCSLRMARLEALIVLDHCPSQKPSFSPVKALVSHPPTAGALIKNLFMVSAVPCGQSGQKVAQMELRLASLWICVLPWRIFTLTLMRNQYSLKILFLPLIHRLFLALPRISFHWSSMRKLKFLNWRIKRTWMLVTVIEPLLRITGRLLAG